MKNQFACAVTFSRLNNIKHTWHHPTTANRFKRADPIVLQKNQKDVLDGGRKAFARPSKDVEEASYIFCFGREMPRDMEVGGIGCQSRSPAPVMKPFLVEA